MIADAIPISTPQKQRLKAHFGMTRVPFCKTIRTSQMFDSSSQRELYNSLILWSEIRGMTLVIGDCGVGKSITLRRFVYALDKDHFYVYKLSCVPSTPVGLLRSLCRVLGLPVLYHAADLFDTVQNHLATYQHENGPHPLLVIDDADGMKVSCLDVLRRLTTFDLDAETRFSIVLAGTDALIRTLPHPTLKPLRSRFVFSQSLRPFNLEDTRNYIAYHLRRVDAQADLMSDPAISKVFAISKGIPREVNQVVQYLLIKAAACGLDRIDGDFASSKIAENPLLGLATD